MESIEERINVFEKTLNKELVEKRCDEIKYCSMCNIGSRFAKINGIVIGAIVPKENTCNLDFYDGNVGIITLDLEIEKDLNNDKLRLRINGNRLRLHDMNAFDLENYVESYVEDFGYEDKYKLCEQYDCSPSQLVDEITKNEDITEIIGDCAIVNREDKDYLVMFDSGWDLYNIIRNIQEDEKIIWFDETMELLKSIEKYFYNYSNEREDLTIESVKEIANTINLICKEQNIFDKIIQYIEEN